jgi:hypothetical protein
MRVIQDAVDAVLKGLPDQFMCHLIAEKIETQGITLSRRQQKLLLQHVRSRKGESFRIDGWKFWNRRKVQVKFTPEEIEQSADKFSDFIKEKLPDIVLNATEEFSKKVLADLKRKWPAESRRQRKQGTGFGKRLYLRWGSSIELLKMLLTISREFGARTNEELRESSHSCGQRHLIEALTRSHARACQVTDEIICLVSGGFSDGAMARWRTLHEIAVVASFLAEHGEDAAERYILHQVVESKRATDEYERCRARLGYAPLDQKEIEELKNSFDMLKSRFGKSFTGQYGWASHHLKQTEPTFRDIERAARIDHLRSHYKMASHPVHANSKGIFFKLGLLNETPILLAGPSNAGLFDPIQGAALSLIQVTSSLLTLQTSFDNIAALKMMLQLQDGIVAELVSAQTKLEEDEARVGSSVQLF